MVVTLRLSTHEAASVDAHRGGLSRGAYFRDLHRQAVGTPAALAVHSVNGPAPAVEATPAPTLAQTAPAPPIRTTASKIETVAEGKHLFRRGSVVSVDWVKGVQVKTYLCTCGCGEVRSG